MNDFPKEIPKGRAQLRDLMRSTGDVIHIEDAVKTLMVNRQEAAKLLSRWAKQGWLQRVGPGTYIAISIIALGGDIQVVEDPWVLVPALYSPCYIGGRTAAEYWDLTEQIFRDIVVLTSRPIRTKRKDLNGIVFSLKHIKQSRIFGTKIVWRSQTKVLVSDIHRTIIDLMDDPVLGGGIQHTNDCLLNYLKRNDQDVEKLIEYADKLGNGAVFKRLGFLAEQASAKKFLIKACRERLTKGNAKLDPSMACKRIVSRWRLCIPENWKVGA